MRITLLENQIELILDSLQAYTKVSDKKQLIYATYESLLAQSIEKNCKKDLTLGNTCDIIYIGGKKNGTNNRSI